MKETQSRTAAKPTTQRAPTNGQQGIQAMTQARAANNYKQGMYNGTPANTWGAAPARTGARTSGPISPNYGGTNNTRSTYNAQVAGDAPIGYTPGGFDDPTIDWGAIASIFGPQAQQQGSNTAWSGGGTVEGPSVMAPPPTPAVFETPAVYTSPPAAVEAPGIVATRQGDSLPAVQSFDTVGNGVGTFGMFDRMRNARNPRQGLSVTPEMLRRAAQARMGTGA